jgi:hypothetical protein
LLRPAFLTVRFENAASPIEWDTGDGKPFYMWIGADQLNRELSEELVVPTRSLKVTYTMAEAASSDELRSLTG